MQPNARFLYEIAVQQIVDNQHHTFEVLGWIESLLSGHGHVAGLKWDGSSTFHVPLRLRSNVFHNASLHVHLIPKELPASWLIGKLKKGQGLVIQGINGAGQPISLVLPLQDFAKAYDGPPTDPKKFEEQQKQLQDELQKRAEDARKKHEAQQPSAPQSAAPAAPTR